MRPVIHIALWALLALSVAASFVFQTAVVTFAGTAALLLGVTAASAMFLAVLGGVPRVRDLVGLGVRDGFLVVVAGVLATAVAPALVVAHRATDVPPGAVVVFWTTAVWGGLFLIAAAVLSRRFTWGAAAVIAIAGAMGVLGNWERPSSFSLLVRYPDRELAMLLAGILLVGSILLISRMARQYGRRAVYLLAAGSGFAASLVWGVVQTGSGVYALLAPSTALPYFAAGGLSFALTVELARRAGIQVAGSAYLLTPSLLVLLLFIEEATGVFGPRPILVAAVAWASLAVAGAVLIALVPSHGEKKPEVIRPGWAVPAGSALAGVSVMFAAAALVLPGVAVTVTGTAAGAAAFYAEFTLEGFRTVGGWFALAVSLLALGAWLERPSRTASYASAIGGFAVAAAYTGTRFTPLHTWISWIPTEVQHDYGTEYANIVFEPVPVEAQVAAVVIAVIALVAFVAYRIASAEPGSLVNR